MTALINLTDQPFGRLIARRIIERRRIDYNHVSIIWECECKCGNTCQVNGANLRNGNTNSCGCLRHEALSQGTYIAAEKRRTGFPDLPEYWVHSGMMQRCYNTNYTCYKDYGGRGISVCDRWMRFEFFYADMGPRPGPEYSLERKDNNANYSCGQCLECVANGWAHNVTWATRATQSRNTRRTRWITFKHVTLCLKDWAIKLGMDQSVLRNRLKHWSVERALTEPVHHLGQWRRPTD